MKNPALTLFKYSYINRLFRFDVLGVGDRFTHEDVKALDKSFSLNHPKIIEKAKAAGVFSVEPSGKFSGEAGKLDNSLHKLRAMLKAAFDKPAIKDNARHKDLCAYNVDLTIEWFRTALYYFIESGKAKTRTKVDLYEESCLRDFYFHFIYQFANGFAWAVFYSDENRKELDKVHNLLLDIDRYYNKAIAINDKSIKTELEKKIETCTSSIESIKETIEAENKSWAIKQQEAKDYLARSETFRGQIKNTSSQDDTKKV